MDKPDRGNLAIIGCLSLLVIGVALGLAMIALGWLFGIGLRLAQ